MDPEIQICVNKPLPGFEYCRWCKCELEDCTRPRHYSIGRRWCKLDRRFLEVGPQYVNQYGDHRFEKGWSVDLRLAAKLGFALMHILPADVVEFLFFFDVAMQVVPGESIRPEDLILLLLASTMKWPPVLRHLLKFLAGEPAFAASSPAAVTASSLAGAGVSDNANLVQRKVEYTSSPEKIHEIVLAMVSYSDGQGFDDMHDDLMTKGQVGSSTGLVFLGKKLGCLCRASGSKSKGQQVALGRTQTSYLICNSASSQESCEHLRTTAKEFSGRLQWPASGADVEGFCDGVVQFVQKAFNYQKPEYEVKTVARKIIAGGIQRFGSSCMDAFTMEKIVTWAPDQKHFVDSIKHWHGIDVRQRFGFDPFWLSCWLCILGMMSTTEKKTLNKASSSEVVLALRSMMREHGRAGTPGTLARELAEGQTGAAGARGSGRRRRPDG